MNNPIIVYLKKKHLLLGDASFFCPFLKCLWVSESGFTGLKDKQDFDLLGGEGITNYELTITNNHPKIKKIILIPKIMVQTTTPESCPS